MKFLPKGVNATVFTLFIAVRGNYIIDIWQFSIRVSEPMNILIIFVVSLFGSYLGSINCLTIYDIKQIIAYSSITHMNLAVADLFTLNIYGLQGSLVTSLAHGLSSSGLFCSVGFIQDRTDNRNLFTLAFINSFNMYPVFYTSLFLLILGTTSFPGTLNFIGELFNMISLSIVDVVFNGLFVTSIPLTTSYSLFLFKRSCGNIYLNYRNQTMDVSRLYLWIPSAALFPLTVYVVQSRAHVVGL